MKSYNMKVNLPWFRNSSKELRLIRSVAEFRVFVEQTERKLHSLFVSIDQDHNGKVDKDELRAAFKKAGLTVPKSKLDQFFQEVDRNHDVSKPHAGIYLLLLTMFPGLYHLRRMAVRKDIFLSLLMPSALCVVCFDLWGRDSIPSFLRFSFAQPTNMSIAISYYSFPHTQNHL